VVAVSIKENQRMGEMEVWAIQAYGCANMLEEMMTVKSDDIQGRHQAFADMVQGNNVNPQGRTAAFDGLCCEIRGLGLEVTLGQIVDAKDPVGDKTCSLDGVDEKTLEQIYGVSFVDTREEDGKQILEIPAGDYVPDLKPPAPVITSITNGRGNLKPKLETAISMEPLIDDIDDTEAGSDLVSSFIDNETADILSETKGDNGNGDHSNGDHGQVMVDFPSLTELESLASQLIGLDPVSAKTGGKGRKAHDDEPSDDELAVIQEDTDT